jgi:hypothetical protein
MKLSELLQYMIPSFISILFQELEKENTTLPMIKMQLKALHDGIKKGGWTFG